MDKEVLKGNIENYIFVSKDSLYKVANLNTESEDSVVIVGSFPLLEEGLNYEFTGYYKETKYGRQFMVESYSKGAFNSTLGLVNYLSSEKFKGIGPKTALKIVNTLGKECIDVILKDKDSLKSVPGMNELKMNIIYDTIKENYASEQVFVELYSFGLSAKMVYKMFEKYSLNAANIIKENPYRLIYEVDGYGFRKSDALALKVGFELDSKIRISEAVLFTLSTVCNQNGFTFLTDIQLVNSTVLLLNKNSIKEISSELVSSCLEELINSNRVITEENRIYEKNLYKAETTVAAKIRLLDENKKKNKYDKDTINETIALVEKTLNITYTTLQKEAIQKSLTNQLSIITGGPGTGKTTIIRGVIYTYAYLNKMEVDSDILASKLLLAAPTGRAAKRITESTHFNASTIHRALGYNFDGNFTMDEYNPLPASLIIVDEASMIDIDLASKLFQAISISATNIIFVGDENQLPSVGPGAFLHDIIASDVFKTIRLNEIMRQAEKSNIVKLSNAVLMDSINYNIFKEHNEVFFYDTDSKDVPAFINKLLEAFILKGGDLFQDIQVLAPMYAGAAGIDAINRSIQERFNPEKERILVRENKLFKVNDKVLQLQNDPTLEIMNGDIGRIVDIVKNDDNEYLWINFDGKMVRYPTRDIDNLTLAYAISIHKSQGSEYKNVILPIVPSYALMLKKRIIYTAITRAKEKLILLGKYQSVLQSTKTLDANRQTSLQLRLTQTKSNVIRINDPSIPFDTLGEENMEGITPYSFM